MPHEYLYLPWSRWKHGDKERAVEPVEGGRDGDRGGDRESGSPYLLCSAALLADGCQVAQDQLGGLCLP